MKLNVPEDLAVGDITKDMLERRPLPIGRAQFMEWSDRIIKGSLVEAEPESLRFVLAERLQHIYPTEAFKEDAYFILQLRTIAVKETAFQMFCEIKKDREAKLKPAEATALELPQLGAIQGGKEPKNSLKGLEPEA